MNTSLYISEKIKVGFQHRGDTYTGKLAYVIPMNAKGKLKKEKSFESWRENSITPEEFDNEPTSGFVLNKKAGGYNSGWNHRNTYVRVFDPRGFEFEISVDNLLYILEHTDSVVGKGLHGEFMYAWDRQNLVLLPANAPEYKEIKKTEKVISNTEFLKAKDLKMGGTYLTLDNKYLIYLGKFDEYKYHWRTRYTPIKKSRKSFYFAEIVKKQHGGVKYAFHMFSSLSKTLVEVVEERKHPLYDEIMNELSKKREFSPIDDSLTELKEMDLKQFLHLFNRTTRLSVIAENGKLYTISSVENGNMKLHFYGEERKTEFNWQKRTLLNTYNGIEHEIKSLEDIFNILKPKVKNYYLENGHLYETKFNGHDF